MLRVPEQQETIPLPILEDYDVSPITGFVPYPQPLGRLTSGYYQPWEEIMDRLNELIETRQLRARVDEVTSRRTMSLKLTFGKLTISLGLFLSDAIVESRPVSDSERTTACVCGVEHHGSQLHLGTWFGNCPGTQYETDQ